MEIKWVQYRNPCGHVHDAMILSRTLGVAMRVAFVKLSLKYTPLNYLVLMAPFEVTILGPTSSGRLRRALCSARCESQRQGYANTITALRCGVPEGSVMAIAGPFLHRSFLL